MKGSVFRSLPGKEFGFKTGKPLRLKLAQDSGPTKKDETQY